MLKLAPSSSESAATLAAEGELLASLQHPYLVAWTDHLRHVVGLDPQGPVSGFAMRWVDGIPLTRGALTRPLSERLRAFGQLLSVVGYLHRRGILHLDIKPDNVLWTVDDEVRLLDLGSARPLSSGPGEAGGTLGYAAPEILLGQAATTAADLYSLGAVLYELLTGQQPHQIGTLSPDRAAVLSGMLVPVRVLQDDVPPEVAMLTEQLLSAEPSARPRDVVEVAARLRDVGGEWRDWSGTPPLVGRERQLAELLAALRPHRQVVIWGRRGLGRLRLAQEVLRQHASHGGPTLDLSQHSAPLAAMSMLFGAVAPTPSELVECLRERILHAQGWRGCVLLGRREERAPQELQQLERVAAALLEAGCSVIWVALQPLPEPHTETLHLEPGPLDSAALRTICRFFNVHAPARVREVCRDVEGVPGVLIRKLDPDQSPAHELVETEALQLLAVLPEGVPEVFVQGLPPGLREQIRQLVASEGARWSLERRLFVSGEHTSEASPSALALARRLLQELNPSDPLWWALAAARLGMLEDAIADFPAAQEAARHRPTEYRTLCELLHQGGYRPAALPLARLLEDMGSLSQASAILEGLEGLEHEETRALVNLLRRQGRLEEALARAHAALEHSTRTADFWLEIARCELERGRLDRAEEAVTAAEAADPTVARGLGLLVRLTLARARLNARQPAPEVEKLLSAVETLKDDPELVGILMAAVLLLNRLNMPARSLPLLERVTARADQMDDRRTAVGTRINRMNLLVSLGRLHQARTVGLEALQIAEESGAQDLQAHLFYLLTDLELGVGRLPEAQRWGERFQRATEGTTSVGLGFRRQRTRARLLLEAGQVAEAEAILAGPPPTTEHLPADFVFDWLFQHARARFLLGDPQGALEQLRAYPPSGTAILQARARALEGQALIALGRAALAEARATLPGEENSASRIYAGEILLAAAGEDLSPDSFARRRQDLEAAARLLRGEAAARAASLRERLLDGPGADLSGVVDLTESMNDPKRFPAALARLITQALGAHRVLIMIKIPGLGQQMSYNELTGAEAAGIGQEVMRRIQQPDDYWLAADAFSDPGLRASSHTVRTFELKSLVAVAIPHSGKAMGALYVDDLYRAGRFDMEDVAILRRLARAVGEMIPLLQRSGTSSSPLIEPEDVLGVLTCQPRFVEEAGRTVSLLRGQRETNLLLTGETGTGKSVLAGRVARDVLGASGLEVVVLRKGDPNLLIAQLSGSRRGDFTGAVDQEGAIQRALRKGRALFLDEVQNLGEEGQQILLPLLEMPNRHFGGLTGTSLALKGHLHVILGTNVEIGNNGWSKWFREDLWYRMSAVHIHLPPLRERGPEAVYRYLAGMMREIDGTPSPEEVFDAAALYRVTAWRWPGNLRQLRGFAHQAAHYYRTTRERIPSPALGRLGLVDMAAPIDEIGVPLAAVRDDMDRVRLERMLEALHRNDWVQRLAADDLKMKPANFSKLLKRFGLRDIIRERRRLARESSSA